MPDQHHEQTDLEKLTNIVFRQDQMNLRLSHKLRSCSKLLYKLLLDVKQIEQSRQLLTEENRQLKDRVANLEKLQQCAVESKQIIAQPFIPLSTASRPEPADNVWNLLWKT